MQCLPEWQLNYTFSLADYSDSSSTRRRRRSRLFFPSSEVDALDCRPFHVVIFFTLIIKMNYRLTKRHSSWSSSTTEDDEESIRMLRPTSVNFHELPHWLQNSASATIALHRIFFVKISTECIDSSATRFDRVFRWDTALPSLRLSSTQLFLAAIDIISVCCTPTISCHTGNFVNCSRFQCCFDLRTRLI